MLLYSQDERRFFFTVKAGASFGGSQPGSYTDNGQANLMIDITGGVGVSYFFSDDWQVCLDLCYVRKGINCPVESTSEINDFFRSASSLEDITGPNVYAWFNNGYIEIPLTLGYTWGYDICRTRIGGYVSRRINTKTDIMVEGLSIHGSDVNRTKEIYKEHLANYDAGIKIANEFYLNNLSVGLEFSAGFIPVIKSEWRIDNSQNSTMAVCIYLGYTF